MYSACNTNICVLNRFFLIFVFFSLCVCPSLTHAFILFIIFRSFLYLSYLSRYFFTKNICNYNNHSIKSNVGNPPMLRLLFFSKYFRQNVFCQV